MCDITMAEDVVELVVLERVDVNIEPAGFMSERGAADESWGGLWGHDMQHIVVLSDGV